LRAAPGPGRQRRDAGADGGRGLRAGGWRDQFAAGEAGRTGLMPAGCADFEPNWLPALVQQARAAIDSVVNAPRLPRLRAVVTGYLPLRSRRAFARARRWKGCSALSSVLAMLVALGGRAVGRAPIHRPS